MVPRIALIILTTISLCGLVFAPSLECGYFDEGVVERSCKVNQKSLPSQDRADLNFQMLSSLSKKNGRDLVKDYNQDIPDSYFEKYGVEAESFYIDEAWVHIQPPYKTVKNGEGKFVSPLKGRIPVKTGYRANERAKRGFIDIDSGGNSCSNQAKLLDVKEDLKTNLSSLQSNGIIDYSIDESATVEVVYTLKTKLKIRDRDLVCTGEEKCNLKCREQSFTTTVEKEKFRHQNTINIDKTNLNDFSIGKTSSKTVLKLDKPGKYFEVNFSFGKESLYLRKKVEGFHRSKDGQRFYPVYGDGFQTKKLSNTSVSAKKVKNSKLIVNESVSSNCGVNSRTFSQDDTEDLKCETEIIEFSDKNYVEIGESVDERKVSFFIIPLITISWIYWIIWTK